MTSRQIKSLQRDEGGAVPGRQLELIAFHDIKLGTERRYLVEGVIPRVGLIIVWGPPKSGKSFWMFDVAMHVALGWGYRGRRVHAGPVVYCAFEGQSGFKARVEAFRQRFLTEEPESIPFFLEPVTLDLIVDHPALIAVIRLQIPEGPVLVVLDTLNRSLTGSESSDEDMSAYVRAADVIRETFNCAVVVVHHCGIEGTRPRGHTSLTGAADAQIAVKREGNDHVAVTVELVKDGPQGGVIRSRLEIVQVGTDEDDEVITSCIIVPVEGAASDGGTRVTGAARVALDLLRRAIDEQGQRAPGGPHFPSNGKTVPMSVWWSYCETGTIADSDKPDSRRRAFVRAAKALQSRGCIRVWADHVWVIEPKQTNPTPA